MPPTNLESLLFPAASTVIVQDGNLTLSASQAAASYIERQTTTGSAAKLTFPSPPGGHAWIVRNNCAGSGNGGLTLAAGPSGCYLAPDTTALVTFDGAVLSARTIERNAVGDSPLGGDRTVLSADRCGVPADGVTDATASLNALLATGLPVRLAAGKTYLVSNNLQMLAGQILWGNGATVKRAAQVSDTTATTLSSGVTTQITVTNGAQFAVGQQVLLINGSTWDQSNRQISAINGNVLTLATTVGINASGTTTVAVSYDVVDMAGDCRIYDLVIDGNKANWTSYRWSNTKEIQTSGSRCIVSGCRLNNSPGEGIYVTGGDYHRILDNWITNTNGNGLHLSGTNNPLIHGNRLDTTNLDTSVGHADGCMTFSNLIADAVIQNNYFANSSLAGIGSIDSPDNSDVTIIGNVIKNCTTWAINIQPPNVAVSNVVIVGNRCYSCGPIAVYNATGGTASAFPSKVVIADNYLYQTRLNLTICKNVLVSGNLLEYPGEQVLVPIGITDTVRCTIQGNQIIGGQYGVYLTNDGHAGSSCQSNLINANLLSGQYNGGIKIEEASVVNTLIQGNVIENDAGTASSTYDGIALGTGEVARGNSINIVAGRAGIHAISAGAIIEHNLVRSTGATYSIRADAGTTTVIKSNYVTAAVSDGGTNTLSDNTTIS